MVLHVQQIFVTSAKLTVLNPQKESSERTFEWVEFEKHVDGALELVESLVRSSLKFQKRSEGMVHTLKCLNVGEEDIVRIIVDLLLAASDTTSITAVWIMYILASQQQLQKRVHLEINDLCDSRCATVKDAKNNRYINGLVKEAMRLYPVAPFLTRITSRNMQLGPYKIEAGTLLLISSFAMGRDSSIFDNPMEVQPDRWNRSDDEDHIKKKRKAFSVLPFGHGVRGCIGRRVAEMELALLVARVCQKWNIETVTDDVGFTTRMVGVPEQPIELRLQKM